MMRLCDFKKLKKNDKITAYGEVYTIKEISGMTVITKSGERFYLNEIEKKA